MSDIMRRTAKWACLVTLLVAGGFVAFSPSPGVYHLDLREAVIGGDYSLVASFAVHNYGGPGFVKLAVELDYAGETYTRELFFFLTGDRYFELTFREPTFLGGVLHVLSVDTVGVGGLEGILEASTATLRVRRLWPP